MFATKLGLRSAAPTVFMGLLAALGASSPLFAQTTVTATMLRKVTAVRQTVATITNSTVWVNVPGATATFTVPANNKDVFIANYTAESVCYGASGWCPVRILANGIEMDPASGTDFAFDSSDGGAASPSSWESHSVDRSKVFTAGTAALNVTIQVQYMATAAGMTFRLDDWHLTVQQFH